MRRPESYASVWDAIADTPEQAANLRARAELMQKIAARVKRHDWTQAEAARRCGVTQPRINDLLRGRVSRFSLDALVNIATALGCRVRVDLEAAWAAPLSEAAEWPVVRLAESTRPAKVAKASPVLLQLLHRTCSTGVGGGSIETCCRSMTFSRRIQIRLRISGKK
jgi:predicted XRE-type DNA-binding protein